MIFFGFAAIFENPNLMKRRVDKSFKVSKDYYGSQFRLSAPLRKILFKMMMRRRMVTMTLMTKLVIQISDVEQCFNNMWQKISSAHSKVSQNQKISILCLR